MSDRYDSSIACIVGRNIASQRKRLGMNQDELADILGISAAALSRIENGITAPRFSRLADIAVSLQCNVSDLFRSPEDPLEVSLLALGDRLRKFPPDVQKDLVALLEDTLQSLHKTFISPKK